MPLALNPRLVTRPFDGSGGRTVMLELPTVSGRTARFLVPQDAVHLLSCFASPAEPRAAIQQFSARPDVRRLDDASMARLVDQCVAAGILVNADETATCVAPDRNRARYLSLKATLLPRGSVARVTRWLTWLFHPAPVTLLLPLCVAAQVTFATLSWVTPPVDLDLLTAPDVLIVLLATSALGLAHELGHATALARYGYPTATIGWGVYLTMTVFYTDLSDAWRLKRRQRAVVDAGGLYFQAIGVAALVVLATVQPSDVLSCTIWFSNVQMLSSLNPIFRMDGYWFIADLYGLANLRAYSSGTIEQWARRLLGFKQPAVDSSLPTRTRRFILLYSMACTVFFVLGTGLMAERVVVSFVPSVARRAADVWLLSGSGHLLSWDAASILGALLWRVLALVGLAVFVVRACSGLARSIKRIATCVPGPSPAPGQAV